MHRTRHQSCGVRRAGGSFPEPQIHQRQGFSDVEKGHWAYSYINAASEAGWILGYPDGTFRPDKEITRTETVTLVNSMINRTVTREKLKALNVRNPYNDLAESFWGYTDLMEATVSHTAEEWHDAKYNDGKYNIIVEKFVDIERQGNSLSPSLQQARQNPRPRSIPAYESSRLYPHDYL